MLTALDSLFLSAQSWLYNAISLNLQGKKLPQIKALR